MSNEISGVKNYFASRQVPLSDDWLESCIQWCKEENPGSEYTLKDLQLNVFQQWLLLDLREVEIQSLPPDLSAQKKYILNGNYSLQVMQTVDISRPKHWQLQKIRNDPIFTRNNCQDKDVTGTGKRVLQLTLTDGVQEIIAMEYRPIPFINVNLTPGTKVRLMGPVTVRRGRLMLEEKNIKILGGEVEDLAVSHAAENVLARALNLPENPTPRTIDEKMDVDNEHSNLEGNTPGPVQANTTLSRQNVNQNNQRINIPRSEVRANTNTTSVQSNNTKCTNNVVNSNIMSNSVRESVNYRNNNSFDIDEEMRIAAEIDNLLEAEADFVPPPAKIHTKPIARNKSPDLFEDEFDFNPTELNPVINNIPIANDCKAQPDIINISDSLDDGDDIFENIDIDAHLGKVDNNTNSNNNLTNSPQKSAMNIAKLLKNKPYISKGNFKIKAKFQKVVEKLTMADAAYKMVIRIEDDSGELDARLHTNVISDLAGYSADALINLKSRILEHDEDAKQTVLKRLFTFENISSNGSELDPLQHISGAISQVKEKLIRLDSLMEIQVNKEEVVPTIINLL